MDVRHPLYQAIASVLAGILILNPIVAAAAELAVDAAAGGNTAIGAAGNGVPVVNIATPNGAGLSHNKFTDYNVGQNGLILNNATGKTQSTQLGGIIVGNPNLKGGAAQKILNEVTGANPSQLRGYTEVAGQAAHVIVANPHGITCNGCGFINTPRATLTTGKPLMDGERLRGYDVDGGEIAIEGAGLNASNLDRFELITRSAKLNAELYANQLDIVTGRNQVDAETLAATAKADDGSPKPQLAIDSSALGGMYAGAIRLVGTEQGVGVKLAGNMAASAGDIQIDANGQLSLAQTSTVGSLRAKAPDIAVNGPAYAAGNVELQANGTLSNQSQLAAGSRVQLQGAQVSNSGIVEAGVNLDNSRNAQGDVAISTQNLRNSGSVVASRTLDVSASGSLDNQGGSLRGANTTLNVSTLNNHQGRLLAGNALSLSGQQLSNIGGQVGAQFIQVQGGALDNRFGLFSAEQSLNLDLAGLDNQQGTLSSRGAFTAQVGGTLNNSQGGSLVSDGAQQLRAGQLLNQNGGRVSSRGPLNVQADALDNRGGTLVSDAALNLSGGSLDNREQGHISARQGVHLNLDSLNNAGVIQSDAALQLQARTVSNATGGQIAAKGDLGVQVERLDQTGGQLLSEAHLQVQAQRIDNRQGGWIGAMNGIDLRAGELFNLGGEISSRAAVSLNAGQFDNSAGRVTSDGLLHWRGDSLVNRAGSLVGQGGVSVTGRTLDNSQGGKLSSLRDLNLNLAERLDNQAGQMVGEGVLNVSAAQVDNRAGVLSSAGALRVTGDTLNNQGGTLVTDSTLNIAAQTLDNRQGGVISAKGALTLTGETLLNSQSGRILGGADLLLAHTRVDNSEKGRIEAAGRVAGQVRTLDQHGAGQLVSNGGIDLDFTGGSLDNSAGGLLATPGALLLRNLTQLNNAAGEVSSQQGFALQLATLNNQGGKLLSDGALSLSAQTLDNRQGGVISAKGALTLTGETLLNSQSGRILGGAELLLAHTRVDNSEKGRIEAADRVAGQVRTLDQHGAGQLVSNGGIDLDFAGGSLDNSAGGLLATPGALLLRNLTQLNNSAGGEVSSQQGFALQLATLNNQGGKLLSDGALSLSAQTLDNRQGGVISAKGALDLRGETLLNSQSGRILGGADLLLAHTRVDNSEKGRIEAAGRVSGQVWTLDQHATGQLVSNGGIDLDFAGGSLDNSGAGLFATSGTLQLRNLSQLNNSAGGEVSSQGNLGLQVTTLNNQGGKLLTDAALNLTGQSLDNRQSGVISAKGALTLRGATLLNSLSGRILGGADLLLALTNLDNSDHGRIEAVGRVSGQVQSLDQHGAGQLVSNGGIDLDFAGGSLDNSTNGLLATTGALLLRNLEQLDNRAGGQLVSEDALSVNAAQVDNRSGVLSSGGALAVTGDTLNNQGGKLLTDSTLMVIGQTLDNRLNGVISAKGALDLRGASLLNSQSGRVLGGADLLLAHTRVDNSDHGRIEVAGRVAGQVRTLDQHGAGQLVSNGGIDLDFAGGSLDNSTNGLLATPGALLLRNLAQLNNSNGGEISSQQSFLLALAGLNNQGGRILSSDALTLQVQGALDNSQAGVLFGRNQLQLNATDLDNSLGGTVASQGGITASLAGQLDNSADGAVAAGGSSSLNSASLNNHSGSLSAAQDLSLVTGTTDNQSGRITAQQRLDATTGDLDNRNGILSGQHSQRLQAQAIDNRAGLITSQGQLELSASRVDNSQGGELSAGGALQLRVQQLIQQQGRLITGGDLSLDMAGGDFDNRNAVLSVAGLLRIDNLRHLDNRGGEISSQHSFQLTAASLDNGDAGRLISAGLLTLNTGALRNANQGLLSGWQGLVINAADLDNSQSGTLSSKLGSLDLSLSGSLDNHGEGALVSLGDQRIAAANLDNRGGILSGQSNLDLAIAGTLDNRSGGLINAQQHLAFTQSQADLLNQGGQISAASLDLSARSLDNSGGLLLSQGALTGTLSGALINANNARLASGGNLLLRAASLDNRGGQLASQQRLELNAGSLDNSQGGTLASQQDLILNLGQGSLDNHADGLLHSASGALRVSAGSLNNQGGTLNGQGDTQLQLSGLLDNRQQGRIQSRAGNLLLQSASLDNSAGGILYSVSGLLQLLTGSFNNTTGIAQAQRLDLTATGGIDNRGGHLSAVSGDSHIATTTLDNQGGGLYAGNLLSLRGDTLLNQGGQAGAATIDFSLGNALLNQNGLIESSGSLSLAAGSLDNQGGRLRALGQGGTTTLNAGYLDNRSGRLETANTDLALSLGGLANDGGTFLHVGTGQFGVNAGQIVQAGGSFITTGHLDITADSWSNSSVLQAGWLNLNIGQFTQTASGKLLASQALTGRGGNWNNDGLLASDGTLDIQLTGTYSGAGRVTSLGALNLSANRIDLANNGSIAGGQNLTLGASQLDNHGRITATGDLTANTGALNNFATLGSSGKLQLNTGDLLNDGETSGALIFSGDDMALRVGGTLTNRYADIYSLGNLDITGATPDALAGALKNISATLESLGDMGLRVRTTENRTDVLNTTAGELLSAAIGVRCYDCTAAPQIGETRVPSSHLVWVENYRGELGESSPSAAISAGGNLNIEGQSLLNQASTIAASGNIAMRLDSFTNSGVAIGDYSVRRSFEIPYSTSGAYGDLSAAVSFWNQVMAYNAANDPDYDSGLRSPSGDMTRPNLHFWNRDWDESLELVTIRAGGREATRFGQFGSIRVEFPGASPFADFQLPHYQPGARVDAPAVVQNAPVFDELIVQSPGSSFVNAVVQAGGNVVINATQDLTNSVIREGIPRSAGASRVGETGISGNTATVVALNAQLPPDLAQQQVNPITLPGFTLPTGSNGLFRLSGQEGSQSSAQTISAGGSYDFAGQSISLSQRERALDSATGKAGDIQRGSDAVGLAGDIQRGATGMTGEVQRSDASGTSGDIPRSGGTGMSGDVQRISGTTGTADTVQLSNGAIAQGAAAGASLSVAQVQGVPSTARPDNRHKYLIETNPELTSLKSFLSSDYLLGLLGYDPDKSQKRLGDGLYEQRLIRDAVVARTGQRYINGITDDENLFKYLMDNAIAYKDKVHLSLGVALTAEQVAALTHDLVWLEEAEVNGEKVLVPVLYLAQANNRLAPNGALIMGNDVSLISGGNLVNQGTLRASGDLAASAANLDNTGLIEASGRLDLLALNTLTNKQGGIISGRDVSLTSLTGDVINQRSVTVHEGGIGNRTWTQSFADSTARIEAAGKLEISAGRDINNLGGAISSGSDLSMQAGRDINLHSVELENSRTSGRNFNQSTTQLGSDISVGRDFTVEAGRDISVVGSRIEVGRDAGLSAGRDVTLASAADEQYSYDKSKKVTAQEDHVTQRGTELSAGRDVLISAGQDLTLISSKIGAGNEAYLVAGDKIEVLAANDSDYSLYDKKDKGSFGQKKTRYDEVTDVKAVGSEISAGGDITLLSGGDQKYQAAKLDSGNDIAIVSGGAVTFEAVKDLHQEAHSKEDSDLSWSSSSGKGKTDETLRQSELIAQGNLAIKAVGGLKIDYKQIDKQSVSQAIDAMVKADPNLAWLKDAEARGDVDWRAVKELHDSYSYSHSGMGQGTSLAVAIVVTYLTWGAGSAAVGVASTSATGVAANSVVAAVASNTAISTVNNRGDLGEIAKDVTSSDSLKSYAAAGIGGAVGAQSLGLQLAVNSAMNTVLQGGSFKDNLGQAAIDMIADAVSGYIYNGVGNALVGTGIPTKVAVHAIVGGLIAEAAGGDFRTAALAAGANEAVLAAFGSEIFPGEAHDRVLAMTSQLIGITVASGAGGDSKAQEKAGWVAQQASVYNYLDHVEVDAMAKELLGCRGAGDPSVCRGQVQEKFQSLNDEKTGAALYGCKGESESVCSGQYSAAQKGSGELDRLMNLASFTEEEKDILSHFQDINHNDQRVADHAWLQSFWQESGAAGGVLVAGAAGLATAGEKAAASTATNAAKPNANSTSALTDGEAGFSNLPTVGEGAAATIAKEIGGLSTLGRVEGTYSAVKPGPLADNIAETFSGGRYSVVTLEKDTVLYRAGTADKPLGQFFSSEPPSGVIQTRIDKAVLPEWPGGAKSPLDTTFEVKIPAGTKVYVGEVGAQGGFYTGGTQQIVIQKPWMIDGVEVINSSPLK